MKRKFKIIGFLLITWSFIFYFSQRQGKEKQKEKNKSPSEKNFKSYFNNLKSNFSTSNSLISTRNSFIFFDGVSYISKTKISFTEDAFARHKFNQRASDDIGMERSLPDTRDARCKLGKAYKQRELPAASIIITYHNEARSTLLRTVVSALSRSSDTLVLEVILVDDFSDDPNDGKELLEIDKVVLVRNYQRQGLVRSRILGAKLAKGEVLVFLDSHCECNEGWLEPLLYAVKQNSKRAVSPVIDIISSDNFQYIPAAANLRGGFDWRLLFKWEMLKGEENEYFYLSPTSPIKTPVIAGGLFAINAEYFEEIGKYDSEMEVWGSENIELSLRIWQCHGSLAIIPCSRVGHVFRKHHPYTFPNGTGITFLRNSRRVAEVWMDDYKKYFYATLPSAKNVPYGNVSSRVALRQELECKSFKWYMQNIYPELEIPAVEDTTLGSLEQDGECLDTMGQSTGAELKTYKCHKGGGNQEWALTRAKQIRHFNLCVSLTSNLEGSVVLMLECSNDDIRQKWRYHKNQLIYMFKDLCLQRKSNEPVLVNKCDENVKTQLWHYVINKN